jgi:O-antigen/teichoic acid export membrane protein
VRRAGAPWRDDVELRRTCGRRRHRELNLDTYRESRPRREAPGIPPGRAGGAQAETPLTSVGTWDALVRGFATLALGDGVARLPGIAAILLLARRLEPTDFGVVMLGLTLFGWCSLLVDSGTETLGTRDISRQPGRLREIAAPILGLRLALSIGGMALLGAVAWVAAHQPADRTILALFGLVLPATALNLRTMVLGVRATRALAAGNVASQAAFLAGIAVVVHGAEDVVWVPLLKAAAELGYAAVMLAAMRRRFGFVAPRVDAPVWAATLRQSLPLFANGLARAVMFSSGVVLLGAVGERHDVGLYGAAHRPVVVAAAVSGLLLVSFLPSYSAAGREDAMKIFRRTVWLGAAAIPAAIGVSATSGILLRLVFGEPYAAAAPALAVLIWAVPVILVGGPWGIVLIAANRQGRLLRNNLVGAAFAIVATVAGAAAAGIAGAAAVAVVAQGLVVALNYRTSVSLGIAPGLGAVLTGRASARRAP